MSVQGSGHTRETALTKRRIVDVRRADSARVAPALPEPALGTAHSPRPYAPRVSAALRVATSGGIDSAESPSPEDPHSPGAYVRLLRDGVIVGGRTFFKSSDAPDLHGLSWDALLYRLFRLATPDGSNVAVFTQGDPSQTLSVDGRCVTRADAEAVLCAAGLDEDLASWVLSQAETLLLHAGWDEVMTTVDERAAMDVSALIEKIRRRSVFKASEYVDALLAKVLAPGASPEEVRRFGRFLIELGDEGFEVILPLAEAVCMLSYGTEHGVGHSESRMEHLDPLVTTLIEISNHPPRELWYQHHLFDILSAIGSPEALRFLEDHLHHATVGRSPHLFQPFVHGSVRSMNPEDLFPHLTRLVREAKAEARSSVESRVTRDNISTLLKALVYLIDRRFEAPPEQLLGILKDLVYGSPDSRGWLDLDGLGLADHLLFARLLDQTGEAADLKAFLYNRALPLALAVAPSGVATGEQRRTSNRAPPGGMSTHGEMPRLRIPGAASVQELTQFLSFVGTDFFSSTQLEQILSTLADRISRLEWKAAMEPNPHPDRAIALAARRELGRWDSVDQEELQWI